jgi:hypothetical protein
VDNTSGEYRPYELTNHEYKLYVKHLEESLGADSNNRELFGVQTNALGSKILDLLP